MKSKTKTGAVRAPVEITRAGARLTSAPVPPKADAKLSRPALVVGVGAGGNGGNDAVIALVKRVPVSAGITLVIATDHAAGLAARLAKATSMPVAEVARGVTIEPNHVYVTPPDAQVTFDKRRLEMSSDGDGRSAPSVDLLFRSIAVAHRDRAIGVILSGPGSDGAIGIAAIKAAGGVTFTEEIRSAKHDGMPQSALRTGAVDFMLAPDEIGARIGEIARAASQFEIDDATLAPILAHLHVTRGIDLREHRAAPLRRRVARRMLAAHATGVEAYLHVLKTRPNEGAALARDLLVRVTSFFRDGEVFAALSRVVLPELLRVRPADVPLRVWVPGCATGEEAYSIAIAIEEAASAAGVEAPFQIFASDVDEESLDQARDATYSESIALDVSPQRLQRFFTRAGKRYQVAHTIRDACIFSRQDVAHDPPFSRLDLVSCRDVLVHLEPDLARRVLTVLHFALRPAGFLVVGQRERIAASDARFEVVDEAHRIFAKGVAAKTSNGAPGTDGAPQTAGRRATIERRLTTTMEHLDLAIEQQNATNEELLSSNEELQSINDELTAMKEELVAVNEELQAVNDELARKNVELANANDDLSNVLASANIPMVIVNRELKIRRFTPQAARVLRLIPSDVGRPLVDIKLEVDVPELTEMLGEVIEAAGARERDVQDREGRWYAMRVRPYMTRDHRIDGAVILFVDVDRVKRGSFEGN